MSKRKVNTVRAVIILLGLGVTTLLVCPLPLKREVVVGRDSGRDSGCDSTSPVTSPVVYMRAITPSIMAYDKSGNRVWPWPASGVWIDKIHVLTARHIVQNPDSGVMHDHWDVTDANGRVHTATAATLDLKHDVAMLTIADEYDGPVAKIGTDILQVGDEVVMAGWALGLGLEITFGRVANVSSDPNGWGEGDVVVAITCGSGCSGGPIFKDGKLIGIVSRGAVGFLVIEPILTFGLTFGVK